MAEERRTAGVETRSVNQRTLIKQVQDFVDAIERSSEKGSTVHTTAEAIITRFRDDLGIHGGRLYRREGSSYVLIATFGDARVMPEGFSVPAAYPPIAMAVEDGTVFMEASDPRLDRGLEEVLGAEQFAAIEVDDGEYILAFDVSPGHAGEDAQFSLGILRHAINQKIRTQRMEGIFHQARKIQASILPRRVPIYGEFDMAGRSDPMESVGGDFYDFIPITDKIFGLAIADVSGHGLPAALQVRDIYMGLRMGLSRDLKIIRTVERLNQIIHKSTLTSRFVSLFYGELEPNGVFIYVNAGHPPPFHLMADGTHRYLEEGGAVLGPLLNAAYERGFIRMSPGDVVVLYTDGIIETEARGRGPGREEYGVERLIEVVRENVARPASEIVAAVFASVEKFSGGRSAKDDRTVVVVRLPPAG
jgi:sigma-B regulation protein RsbU (phosphoserine phosphatase)